MLIQEKILLKITLVISLLGMLLLIFISQKIAPQDANAIPINTLQDREENSQVTIMGVLESVINTPTILILKVKDNTGTMTVIAGKKEVSERLRKGMSIEVIGTLKTYEGKQELEAQTMKVFV